jgi:CO/xanthine dehydrogenase Mo-binding subunit
MRQKQAAMTKIGMSVKRVGMEERVSGALKYAADLKFANTLHVKLVRLDVGHARIRSIDTAEACDLEGVHFVLTDKDLPVPMPRYGPFFSDQPIIATGEVKFYGDPVAAVVAETEDLAEKAARLVKVDYEELPGVYTLEQALMPGAPLVQDPSIRTNPVLAATNILDEWRFGWGDPDHQTADLEVEDTFNFPMTTHFAIEPHVFIAAPDHDGVIIWSTVQHPFLLQRVLSQALKMPLSKIRIVVPELGGGFGGKGYPKFEPLVAFLAMKLKRTVRLRMTLDETFLLGRRNSSAVRVKAGFRKDGKLAYMKVFADFLIGAYANASPRVVAKAALAGCGIYNPAHVQIHARAVLSHTVPGTAFRGFGSPQFMWALDSIMDIAANALGIDRLEMRLKNIAQKGEVFIHGEKPSDGNWAEGLSKAAKAINWGAPLPPNHGRGLGIGVKTPAPATVSQSMVRMHSDGSLTVLVGTTEMGQGARTVMAQLASDAMTVPMERITVINGDTGVVPFDSVTASSRSTVFMGNAVQLACEDLKEKLRGIAADWCKIQPAEVRFEHGKVLIPGDELEYTDLLRASFGFTSGEVVGIGTYKEARNPHHPLGGGVSFYEVIFAGAEVEVDKDTGFVHVKKLVTVGDIGKAINPLLVETQDEGGAIQGLGHSLMEHLIMDERGRILNLGALDYRIPTTQDTPDVLKSMLVENMDGSGPAGAKGTGESGIIPIGSAIGLAVSEATGVVFHDLPLTPERVWRVLNNQA